MNAAVTDFLHHVGFVLLHTLWIFSAIAVVLWFAMQTTARRSARTRYAMLCTAMLVMVATLPITYVWVDSDRPVRNTEIGQSRASAAEREDIPSTTKTAWLSEKRPPSTTTSIDVPAFHSQPVSEPTGVIAQATGETRNGSFFATTRWLASVDAKAKEHASLLAIVWLLGVALLSLRPLVGWRHTKRLRRGGNALLDGPLEDTMKRIASQLGIRRRVEILESSRVIVPTVIGWLKPLILLPPSALTGLSQQQLSDVIAHELAHVRRHDHFFHSIQTLAETVFFYHPAVWWVSHQLRIERENCCDDLVMGLSGDRRAYAEMLVRIEMLRAGAMEGTNRSTPGFTASGASLVDRVRRITQPENRSNGSGVVLLSLTTLVVMGIIVSLSIHRTTIASPPTESHSPAIQGETSSTQSIPQSSPELGESRPSSKSRKSREAKTQDSPRVLNSKDVDSHANRPVQGKVVVVDEKLRLAEITLGINDGIRVGQILEVTRDGQKIGAFVVKAIDEDRGLLAPKDNKFTVVEGDTVEGPRRGVGSLDGHSLFDEWFQPIPYPHLPYDPQAGPDAMFVRIAGDRWARSDLGLSGQQSLLINAVYQFAIEEERVAKRIGAAIEVTPDAVSSEERWESARTKAEAQIPKHVVSRIDELVIRQIGHLAFMDSTMVAKLKLSADQRTRVSEAIDQYRSALTDNQAETDRTMRQTTLRFQDEQLNTRLGSLALGKAKRDRVLMRQLWSSLAATLSKQQRAVYVELRGEMPDSLKNQLPRLQRYWEPYLATASIAVRGRQSETTIFPDIATPPESAFLAQWFDHKRELGISAVDQQELGKIHVIREKIADFVDPPRFYPLIGPARLHHCHYKGTLFIGDDQVDVVYIDSTHLHPIAEGPDTAESELASSNITIEATRPAPQSLKDGIALLKYQVRNFSKEPLTDFTVMVSPGNSVEILGATDESGVRLVRMTSDRMGWEVRSLAAGETRTLEIQARFPSGYDAPIMMTVTSDQGVVGIHRFPKESPETAGNQPLPDAPPTTPQN